MRWILALAALLAASVAHAEMIVLPVAPATRGMTLSAAVDISATHIHGFQAGVFGAEVSAGWRRGTLELYGAADVGILQFFPTSGLTGVGGRLAGGLRWYARGHGEDLFGMVLQLEAGLEAFQYDDARVARPDAALGIGYEIRSETWRLRVMSNLIGFSDDNRNGTACRGCVTKSTAFDVALGMTMGIAW